MLLRIAMSIFIVLHGIVHLLYFGQSNRNFELEEGLLWPDGSWAFSRIFGDSNTHMIANIVLVLLAVGFALGGAGLIFKQEWSRFFVVGVAIASSIAYALLWNGKFQRITQQGLIGILINVALVVVLVLLQWPQLEATA